MGKDLSSGPTARCPDHSLCWNCGEPIDWDEVCYVHSNGFADCNLIIRGGHRPQLRDDEMLPAMRHLRSIEREGTTVILDAEIIAPPVVTMAQPMEWYIDEMLEPRG